MLLKKKRLKTPKHDIERMPLEEQDKLPRYFSSGGGRQSAAALVLSKYAIEIKSLLDYHLINLATLTWNKISHLILNKSVDMYSFVEIMAYNIHIFSNVGNDSERPKTLAYVNDVLKPYAESNGIEFIEIQSKKETLRQNLMRVKSSIPIPIVLQSGAFGNRTCTGEYKIKAVDRYIRGDLDTDAYAVGLGISIDEFTRVKTPYDAKMKWRKRLYPLIELRLSALDCQRIVLFEGLPAAPKSSCYFCPFQTVKQWQELYNEDELLFNDAVFIERTLQARRLALGKDIIWLSQKKINLDQLVTNEQIELGYEDSGCESGYCMT
jgi:3'-phosphoadenosine 5'-phosphosulfate sulfotransferase (PAPS reductase)/FAD synthetase